MVVRTVVRGMNVLGDASVTIRDLTRLVYLSAHLHQSRLLIRLRDRVFGPPCRPICIYPAYLPRPRSGFSHLRWKGGFFLEYPVVTP